MTLPVSLLCCTYGRTRYLVEVIESFRRQDYSGRLELVIVNDAPDQTLHCMEPGVRIVNRTDRYQTLGDKRNATNAYASHDVRVVVDDDDVFLPWFVSEMVRGLEGSWPGFYLGSHYLFATGVGEKLHVALKGRGPAGVPIYTRSAFGRAGGYPSMQSGQDQHLTARMRTMLGREWRMSDYRCRPGYVYRWANGVTHFSGNADGQEWRRAEESHGKNAQEPRGDVLLEPRWAVDYVAACGDALAQWATQSTAG